MFVLFSFFFLFFELGVSRMWLSWYVSFVWLHKCSFVCWCVCVFSPFIFNHSITINRRMRRQGWSEAHNTSLSCIHQRGEPFLPIIPFLLQSVSQKKSNLLLPPTQTNGCCQIINQEFCLCVCACVCCCVSAPVCVLLHLHHLRCVSH